MNDSAWEKAIIKEVGVEAVITKVAGEEAELDICGVRFWMPMACLEFVGEESGMAA